MRNMYLYLSAILIVVLLLIISRPKPAANLILPSQLDSVVRVGDVFKCTGTIVHDGIVLTAGHCITGAIVTVTFINGETRFFHTLTHTFRNNQECNHDYAILRGNTGGRRSIPLAVRHVTKGDLIYRIAYPGESRRQIARVGRAKFVSEVGLETSEQAIPGESGAAFLNAHGEVVGVLDCYSAFFGTAIGGTNKVFQDVLIKAEQ